MNKQKLLMAGAAEIDITPVLGTQIAGNIGVRRPAKIIEQRLFAKALVLQQGDSRLCYFSSDILAIRTDFALAIRQGALLRFKLAAEELIVNCTQNHSSPSVGHCFCLDESFWRQWIKTPDLEWVLGGDPQYTDSFLEKALTVIGQALGRLEPVTAQVGRGIEGRIAFNRRTIMRDGTAQMHAAAGDSNVLQIEGPADPEVGVLVLKGKRGDTVAALLHFTSHPCHTVDSLTIAGGWSGAWCEGVKSLLGGGVPLVVNGCCGNVHPRNPLVPAETKTYQEMGKILAADTEKIMSRLVPVDGPLLHQVRRIPIPLRDLDVLKVRNAERLLQAHPEPIWVGRGNDQIDWQWIYAISILDLARYKETHSHFDYEVQGVRLGDVQLLALTGEPFVEAQLKIKLQSPSPFTWIAHMSNGYVGYIPTPEAIRRGGYETDTCHWSKLAPHALDLITTTSIEVVRELADA
jgi:neutral ceramidase